MTEISERYRKVAGSFTARAEAVPAGAWDNPAPCEGWMARDVVRHLVTWMPEFLVGNAGLEIPRGPTVDEDPVRAWKAVNESIQTVLDDPDAAAHEFDMRLGHVSAEQAIDMFFTGDILIHTWDLARAAGLDEALDPDEVHRLYEGMVPIDEVLRQSGQYGPRVEVPDDADEQTKLIAFSGRHP